MGEIENIEDAMEIIRMLQEQLIVLETSGKAYEMELERTVEELKQELEETEGRANDAITKLEIQIDELQEQNRRLESRYISEREQNESLIQDKLLLQCEVEQLREELVHVHFDGRYEEGCREEATDEEARAVTGMSVQMSQPICEGGKLGMELEQACGLSPVSPLSSPRSIPSSSINSPMAAKLQPPNATAFGNLMRLPLPNPLQSPPGLPPLRDGFHPSTSPPLRVMFKGSSLMLKSISQDETSMIVPSLSQATVMATTSSQASRR